MEFRMSSSRPAPRADGVRREGHNPLYCQWKPFVSWSSSGARLNLLWLRGRRWRWRRNLVPGAAVRVVVVVVGAWHQASQSLRRRANAGLGRGQ